MVCTDIYEMDRNGNVIMVMTYGLPKEEALRNCVLQHYKKRYDTWNYDKEEVTMVPYKGELYHLYDGNVLYTSSS